MRSRYVFAPKISPTCAMFTFFIFHKLNHFNNKKTMRGYSSDQILALKGKFDQFLLQTET